MNMCPPPQLSSLLRHCIWMMGTDVHYDDQFAFGNILNLPCGVDTDNSLAGLSRIHLCKTRNWQNLPVFRLTRQSMIFCNPKPLPTGNA